MGHISKKIRIKGTESDTIKFSIETLGGKESAAQNTQTNCLCNVYGMTNTRLSNRKKGLRLAGNFLFRELMKNKGIDQY